MVPLMKVTIIIIEGMEMEFLNGLMETFTKDLGKRIIKMERVLLFNILSVDMKDSLKMVRKMVLELSLEQMEPDMKEIGKMTINMELENLHFKMDL